MRCRWCSIVLLAALLAAPALAEDPLSYGFVQLDYVDAELDGGPDGDGFDLGLSVELGETLYAFGGYGDLDFEGIELSSWTVGLGAHAPLGERASGFVQVGYIDADVEVVLFGTGEDDGWTAAAGVRGLLADARVELAAAIDYIDLSDSGDDTAFRVEARYNVNRALSLGVGYATSDDTDALSLGARFYFGAH